MAGWTLALTALVATLAAVGTTHVPQGSGTRAVGPLAVAIVVVAVLAAAGSLRAPRVGFVVVAVALGLYLGRAYPNGPVLVTGLFVMFVLGRATDRMTAVVGLATIEAAMLIGWAVSGHGGQVVAFYPGWTAAAAAIGAALRNRRSYLQEHAARAESVARTRSEAALRLVAEDRLRIARDLHDGVAHAMATINVQAAAAAHVVDRRPEAAKDALAAIARASGSVLDELNAMVRLLRDPAEPVARAPAPGLADLDPLIETVRAAGRTCTVTVDGNLDGVASPAATAAYRIVQESLTNVLKHSDATDVTVAVVAGDRLRVTVADNGRSTAGPEGNGIRGMRERVESAGGTLVVASGPGGFTVQADWPERLS
jgi:signal transduction histidine kinase